MSRKRDGYAVGHVCPGLAECGEHPRWHIYLVGGFWWLSSGYDVDEYYAFDTWQEAVTAAATLKVA